MRKLILVLLSFLTVALAIYLVLPSPAFPKTPPNTLQSTEPGDMESTYRRAYYTNYSRTEIMNFYRQQFTFPLQIRLNYPPEDAYTFIRDQTKSSWLEELVHPGRESLYVNGFYPTKPTEQINIDGVHYLNKITIHYYPSQPVSRLIVLALTVLGFIWLKKEYDQI